MKHKLEPELRKRLLQDPDATVRLIVGVAGDLEARSAEAGERGLIVQRQLRIVGALAVTATGRQALALSKEPWVHWIEEDREVRGFAPRGPDRR